MAISLKMINLKIDPFLKSESMSIGLIKHTTGKSKIHLFEQDEAILNENGLVLAYLETRLFHRKTFVQQKISIY